MKSPNRVDPAFVGGDRRVISPAVVPPGSVDGKFAHGVKGCLDIRFHGTNLIVVRDAGVEK